MESSPYKVKDDKVLLCQGVVVVVVDSSFDREPVPSSQTGSARDIPAVVASCVVTVNINILNLMST